MNRAALALALTLVMTVPVVAGQATLPGAVAQQDPDGATTLRLLLQDGQGGTYAYTELSVSEGKATLVAVLRNTQNAQLELLAAQLEDADEPITELGAFAHEWTHEEAPMLTVGVYLIHRDMGRIRLPVVIFENVASQAHLASTAMALVLDDSVDFVGNAVPFLLEAALVSGSNQFQTYPAAGNVDSFQDQPTLYAWLARRADAGHDVWTGLYLARTGSYTGTSSGPGAFQGEKRMDVGVATRIDGATTRVAGGYLHTEVTRDAGATWQDSTWTLTAGQYSDAAGSVPLVTVVATDHREDAGGDLFGIPSGQGTRIMIGTMVTGGFTPLLAVDTTTTHRTYACPPQPEAQPSPLTECVEQTRLTSVGSFVDGAYAPLAGVRVWVERQTAEAWPFALVAGGGPGAQNMGDLYVDVGTFVGDGFLPVAGVRYDDAFRNAHFTFQMMVTAGTYSTLGWQPLLGATYDGVLPLVTTAATLANDERERAVEWWLSAGTFIGSDYAPVVGARYIPHASGGTHEQQHQVAVGLFLLDYRFFVPVAGAQWDGDLGPVTFALAFTTGGTLGAATREEDVSAGLFLFGAFHPVASVQFRDDYDQTSGPGAAQTRIDVGVHGPDGAFVPVVGVRYTSSMDLQSSLGAPTSPSDDSWSRTTVGVYVDGGFVPLVGVTNDGASREVTFLPTEY